MLCGSLQCYFMYIIFSKYLLCMDVLYANVVISLIANGWNAVLHYVLLYRYDYGISGSAIALMTSHALNLILTLLFILVSKAYRNTWTGKHLQKHVER